MEVLENGPAEEPEKERGVLGVTEENGHFAVRIRWKDGKETVRHFPVAGCEIWDTEKKVRLGRLAGSRMVEVLRGVSAEMNDEDFSWADVIKERSDS